MKDDFDEEFDRETLRQILKAGAKFTIFAACSLGAMLLAVYVFALASGMAG